MNTNKRLMRDVDAEEEEGTRKKRSLPQSPSSELGLPQQGLDDFYSWLFDELSLGKRLPLLIWSLFCDSGSCTDPGLLHQLCSLIGSTEAMGHFKEVASQATEMSTNHQSLYKSLESALDSTIEQLRQLACCAFACLAWCRSCNYIEDLPFGADVFNKLFNLSGKNDPHVQPHAHLAICSIAFVDNCVRKQISEFMLRNRVDLWFEWPFMYGTCLPDWSEHPKAEQACVIVACIVGGKKDNTKWEEIEGVLIPPMVNVLSRKYGYTHACVCTAAAYAISRATYGATHGQIEKLFDMGCLDALCSNLISLPSLLISHCLDGISDILSAGDQQGNSKYVEWIVDNAPFGWDTFYYAGRILSYDHKRYIDRKAFRIAAKYGGCPWINELSSDDDDDDDDDEY